MEFGELGIGDEFKLRDGARLSYEKSSETEAECTTNSFGVILGSETPVYIPSD